jgi:uncharacterized Zn finger protein (UPF0148 family)
MSMFKHKPSKLKYRSDTITLDEIHKDLMNKMDSNYQKLEYLSKTRDLIVDYYEKLSGNQYDINCIDEEVNKCNPKNFELVDIKKEIEQCTNENETQQENIFSLRNRSNDNENNEENNENNESCDDYYNMQNNNNDDCNDCEENKNEDNVNISIFSSNPGDELRLLNEMSRKHRKTKKPVKKRKGGGNDVCGKSIFQFFSNGDKEEESLTNDCDDVLEKMNRAKLQEKFLFIVDKSFACSHVKVQKNIICDKCNKEKVLFSSEGNYICKNCGETENIVMETENNNYKETNYEKQKYPYKKINHLKEKLNQFQSKETADVPDEIYDIIMSDLRKKRTNPETVDPLTIRTILKKHRQTNYYEHLQQIYCKVTNSPPITLSRDIEATIIQKFQCMQESFQKHRPEGRSNFLSYYYVLNKLFKIIGLEKHSLFFPLLKSKEKLRDQDNIWAKICRDMNWTFYSSL